MKTSLLLFLPLATLIFALPAYQDRFHVPSLTGNSAPSPTQTRFPPGCQSSAMAVPGDTCDSFAAKHSLGLAEFLLYNPQIGGPGGCPQNVVVWNDYCLLPKGVGAAATSTVVVSDGGPVVTVTAPGPTVITVTAIASPSPPRSTPPASPTPTKQPDTPFTPTTLLPVPTTTPQPARCAINDCWRAFAGAHYGAVTQQAQFCTSLLQANPPVTETNWQGSAFASLPNLPRKQCAQVDGPAFSLASSYCACYTDGQMLTSSPGLMAIARSDPR